MPRSDSDNKSSSPRARSLLVMGRHGTRTFPLPDEGELTIGRSKDCEVPIDDEKVSRRHAILRIGNVVELVDLGSRNGSLVGSRRLAPRETVVLALDDLVTIGGVVLRVQRALPTTVRVWSVADYVMHFEEERAQADRRGGTFALITLRLQPVRRRATEDAATTAVTTREQLLGAEVESALREVLRSGDVIAPLDAMSYRVILRRIDPAEAHEIGRALVARLASLGVRGAVGVVTYPANGRDRSEIERSADEVARDVGYDAPASARAGARSKVMRELEAMVARVADSSINVLVIGETGVGKEVLAATIHERSPRASGPFVGINCAALSETLFESELFGYERGAFTSADRAKPGLLESAEKGTVFLDEIGEMPLSLQAKLLRVLERREVMRLGSLKARPIDVRIVAATNRDLVAEVAARRFRQDLYFRLNGITLTIPPLRERVDEIEPLAKHFLAAACKVDRRVRVPTLTADALDALRRHDWPGNIRELRNVVERALLLCGHDAIGREHLRIGLGGPSPSLPPAAAADEEDGLAPDEVEDRRRLLEALERCAGNQTYAAEMLGISRRTLVSRLQKYKIARPRTRPREIR